jgi:ketosteroid isomerase-like protein
MRTEIPAADEAPAMTADHMRRTIATAFRAYETDDRAALEEVLADDLTFTSPYDDAIDRKTYFERCWPNHETIATMELQRIVIEGDAAYVTYLGTDISGRQFRNTEYFTFRNGKIASVEVYVGPEYHDGRFLAVKDQQPHAADSPEFWAPN